MIEVGKNLPNGATVLAHRGSEEHQQYEVVLGFVPEAVQPFVTWKVSPDTGDAFWGSYHEDVIEAVRDYKERP